MVDVARHAGVSVKTVSRVVNREPNVPQPLIDRVLASVAELGFRRNHLARTLRSGRSTATIGLVIEEFANPFYATIAGVAAEVAAGARHAAHHGQLRGGRRSARRNWSATCARAGWTGCSSCRPGYDHAFLRDEVRSGPAGGLPGPAGAVGCRPTPCCWTTGAAPGPGVRAAARRPGTGGSAYCSTRPGSTRCASGWPAPATPWPPPACRRPTAAGPRGRTRSGQRRVGRRCAARRRGPAHGVLRPEQPHHRRRGRGAVPARRPGRAARLRRLRAVRADAAAADGHRVRHAGAGPYRRGSALRPGRRRPPAAAHRDPADDAGDRGLAPLPRDQGIGATM